MQFIRVGDEWVFEDGGKILFRDMDEGPAESVLPPIDFDGELTPFARGQGARFEQRFAILADSYGVTPEEFREAAEAGADFLRGIGMPND